MVTVVNIEEKKEKRKRYNSNNHNDVSRILFFHSMITAL
jgi:hypothetical protein